MLYLFDNQLVICSKTNDDRLLFRNRFDLCDLEYKFDGTFFHIFHLKTVLKQTGSGFTPISETGSGYSSMSETESLPTRNSSTGNIYQSINTGSAFKPVGGASNIFKPIARTGSIFKPISRNDSIKPEMQTGSHFQIYVKSRKLRQQWNYLLQLEIGFSKIKANFAKNIELHKEGKIRMDESNMANEICHFIRQCNKQLKIHFKTRWKLKNIFSKNVHYLEYWNILKCSK